MKIVLIATWLAIWGTFTSTQTMAADAPSPATTRAVTLFNGWGLTPAGTQLQITSMPLKLILSPDGKTLAGVTAGLRPGMALIDPQKHTLRQWTALPRAFNGLCFSANGKSLYVSGGNTDQLHIFDMKADGSASGPMTKRVGSDPIEDSNFVAGMALHKRSGRLYVCNEAKGTVLVVDSTTFKREAEIPVGDYPHSCIFDANGHYLYVSNWGDRTVSVIDATKNRRVLNIQVGIRPNDMALAPDGRLFVACAGDNTVYVIKTEKPEDNKQEEANESTPPPTGGLEIISTSLYPSSPEGSTPDAVTVSPDGKTLLVVNGDNNDVAMIDISNPRVSIVKGFIPVGWYPTAVATDGKTIYVANGKGLNSRPSYPSQHIAERRNGPVPYDHTSGIIEGWVSFIDWPDDAKLAEYTKQVRGNSPYTPECFQRTAAHSDSAIPDEVGKPCPIKHVLYIIKENRTYDQVLGDLKDAQGKPLGNGDPKLVLFGDDVSPNHHQLAREFVCLDNLYCNSEVSLDGHSWCDGAIATDFRQRKWAIQYTAHGTLPGNAELMDPADGYLWDLCKHHGISYMCYGEGADKTPRENHGTWPGGRNMVGVDGWIHDLQEAEKPGHQLAQFMIMALGEDHTRGAQADWFTPQACVASNDIGVGKIIEAASKSKYWGEMAIFIIEDDAQNGPDHVDAHRTVGFVVSPYVKRHFADSTPYTTTSMVRTMELILGLPPMTQYDAGAMPMFNAFMKQPDLSPYVCLQPKYDVNLKTRKGAPGAAASAKMDFSEVDEAPEDDLNRVLWMAVKGVDAVYPTPIHRAVFMR